MTAACSDSVVSKIYYDLESTGLGETAEITQLSAGYNNTNYFNQYVMPEGGISRVASNITGLSIVAGKGGKRQMYRHNQELQTVDLRTCLSEFNQWLHDIPGDIKLLIAHNGKLFDMPLMIRSAISCNIQDEFSLSVSGFADTLPIFRRVLPSRKSYKLKSLHQDIIGKSYESHNAVADVEALSSVVNTMQISDSILLSSSFEITSAIKYVTERKRVSESVKTMEAKLCDGSSRVISKSMATKIAKSGLSYGHLMKAFERDNENGIKSLLSEKVGNRVRVTNRSVIINAIVSHFRQINTGV